tara:strand:+ start:611 stop:802 length:192 start_codon:yes stop_codon:yes gene_type:complete
MFFLNLEEKKIKQKIIKKFDEISKKNIGYQSDQLQEMIIMLLKHYMEKLQIKVLGKYTNMVNI